jgi:hypothetical protein
MKIGIDISQTQYPGGVANYLENLIDNLLKVDKKNEYVLFGSSLRNIGKFKSIEAKYSSNKNVKVIIKRLPPTALDTIWNKIHNLPIENLIGSVDLFVTSDWTEPPAKKAKKATILYDLLIKKYPEEMGGKIVQTQNRKLEWVKKESYLILAISESTKKDAVKILGLDPNKIKVIYPGFTL